MIAQHRLTEEGKAGLSFAVSLKAEEEALPREKNPLSG